MLLEVYAKIEGFDNYAISNLGNVINIKKNGEPLKPNKNKGFLTVNLYLGGKYKTLKIHRLVANAYLDKIENKNIIDHIDNNPLNNRIDNLRFCNTSENNRNSKMPITNTSGIKGVNWHKKDNKWYAQIQFNKKKIHIGCYEDIEEAKIARQNKARELFGEFLNDCEK